MTRKEFIKLCGILGVGLPVQAAFSSCSKENVVSTDFSGKVIIIGAGAAGLTAGHLLKQRGIDFEILEASSVYGGRMKRTIDFVDFPIPLGAEWLHTERGVFSEIVNDNSIQVEVETVGYGLLAGFGQDRKFVNSTWFDFYEDFIVPSVNGRIVYNEIVQSINYSGDKVLIDTQTKQYEADKVIVTVPVKMLQTGSITFTPGLPDAKASAIADATVWDGFKAFMEFSSKFYPAAHDINISPNTAGQKLYYDASHGQNSTRHVLGLFAVGVAAQELAPLSHEELKNFMLTELDQIFDNQASPGYIRHISQNWNAEPFIQGAYVYDHENWRTVRTLGESVNNKLFFAGEAYTTGDDWGSVHNAARSAIRAVGELVS